MAEPVRIAKSSLVAFEHILSSIAAKPIRSATPCVVAFEHILSIVLQPSQYELRI